jgi:hypothetical protein
MALTPWGRTLVIGLIGSSVFAVAPTAAAQVFSRDPSGGATVRATRIATPLRIDGRLDEETYRTVPALSDFVQTLPRESAPPTERTEAWILFDDDHLYIAGRLWESVPPGEWTANEMRRDTSQLRQNDNFGVMLDTFHDRRNGYIFYTNPLGAIADQIVTDEGNPNLDWNPVWEVRTGRFDGGWTVEMAIPFKSLRYRSGTGETWGLQMRRGIRRKNEWIHLMPLPLSIGGSTGFFRVSAGATVEGLELPPASKNFEIKPYGISRLTTDRTSTPAVANDLEGDFGVDVKYGITANLTADITYNTDFAQVEVDEQQVNLTRFVLSFPEKRDFFLEGRGIFDFGRGSGGGGGGGGNTGPVPTLFYSRRIGLNAGRVVPIDVGGRVTGKVGKFSLGLLNIQTDDEPKAAAPTTNFTVVRVKRDILRRSSIGAIVTNRTDSVAGPGANQAYGADASFGFFDNLTMGGYVAQTRTEGLTGDDTSYQGRFDYAGDRYGARAEYLKVGDHFNPEVGLVRRDDFARSFGSLRFSPRPRSIAWVRKFTWEASLEYLKNGAGQLETRTLQGQFNTELENSDQFSIDAGQTYDLLLEPFEVSDGIEIPSGGYTFGDVQLRYSLGQQRRVSGTVSLQRGQFYDGTITAVGYSGARVSVTPQLSVEPNISINRIALPYGTFTDQVLRARTDFAFSPRMFASGLVQYASRDRVFSSNLRFRWEYRPGSEFFVVYTDERDTIPRGFPALKNRAFVVKMNRLLRF